MQCYDKLYCRYNSYILMEVKIQELHLLIQNSMHFYALKSQTEPAILMSMCPISILVQFVTQLRL